MRNAKVLEEIRQWVRIINSLRTLARDAKVLWFNPADS